MYFTLLSTTTFGNIYFDVHFQVLGLMGQLKYLYNLAIIEQKVIMSVSGDFRGQLGQFSEN